MNYTCPHCGFTASCCAVTASGEYRESLVGEAAPGVCGGCNEIFWFAQSCTWPMTPEQIAFLKESPIWPVLEHMQLSARRRQLAATAHMN